MSLIVTNSFYRFVESVNAPSTDPLILWLNGGKFTLLLDPNFLNRNKTQVPDAPVWVDCYL
jgi:hypothetical protein